MTGLTTKQLCGGVGMIARGSRRKETGRELGRVELHRACVARVARKLRRLGHAVAKYHGDGADLVVSGLKVAVRAARSTQRKQTVKQKGRIYRYVYPTLHFNLHVRGVRNRVADVFVCLCDVAAFVIPRAAVTGKTVSIHKDPLQAEGQYARYRGAWSALGVVKRRKREAA